MTKERADIRKEIADIRAEQQREMQDTGAQEEINRLRAALDEKQEVIHNLEDERNSYKVALNLLTKEFANSETPNNDNQEQKENSFKVVTNKNKKKKKPGSKPDQRPTTNSDSDCPSRATQDRRHVMIIGDSTLKNVEGWRIGRSTRTRTTIKSFPGAAVADCYHYFKPPLDSKPDEVIIHVGANDLKTNSARSTAESIVDLPSWTASQRPTITISISEVTTREDQDGLGCKVKEVNKILKKLCRQNELQLISHNNIDESSLNRSKLHLNKKGTGLLLQIL